MQQHRGVTTYHTDVRLHPIGGASGDDELGAVEGLLSAAALCITCLAEKARLAAHDVEMALRVLLRTSNARPADRCHVCGSALRVFTAPI